jgi:intein/homing endonuclease
MEAQSKEHMLAEFLGILLGDGNLNKSSNCITIVGSLEELDYYNNFVIPLITSIFKIKPNLRFRKDRNAIYIDFNSKYIMDYLSKDLGLVRGSKKYAYVPNLIKNNPKLIPHFLRGLFDTDGCFKFSKETSSRNYYPRIHFALVMLRLRMRSKI